MLLMFIYFDNAHKKWYNKYIRKEGADINEHKIV